MTDQTPSPYRPPTPRNPQKYAFQGLLAIGAIALGVWGVMLSVGGDANAQVQGERAVVNEEAARKLAVDATVVSQVKRLCDQVCLQPEDFVALGVSSDQCEAAMTRLKDWVKANRARLDQAEQAIAAAESDLRELQRKIRTGEATEKEMQPEAVTAKHKAIGKAIADQKALMLEGGSDALAATVGREKAQRWKQAQTWASILPAEVRYHPDMDRRRLEAILRERDRLGVPLDEVLSFSEKRSAEQTKSRIAEQGQAMKAAWQRAVPTGSSLLGVQDPSGTVAP